ncbi:Acid phosphatase [Candida viswanathii]|uniref:Acid phosphatase n=1 Tax=Candida viswanathii TaxID=5486 RepID=A0A367XQ13_9ASCO|nr:Acid phosphatase [Candida viswanathii]RCK55706.1 Acid phosphatase [Candida viswanathii]
MQFLTTTVALLASFSAVLGKNILLTNDDGWQATNIRATYYKLKDAGHNVFLVAPVSQRSGYGGKFDIPTSPTLQTNGEFSYPAAGAPSWDHEVDDDHIWYFNGTPASLLAFGLQYVIPRYGDNVSVDLVVSGPNEGLNSGGFFTLSGTIGATYNAVYRGIPGVAFSGSNSNNSFFKDSLDLNDQNEPSTIYANLVVDIVQQLFKAQGENSRTLPLGVGLNVNFPKVGYQDESCSAPGWTFARVTGEYASAADLVYNETSNAFVWNDNGEYPGLAACNNGDCSLPSEDYVLDDVKCQTTVSVFSVDYDANLGLTSQTRDLLGPLLN